MAGLSCSCRWNGARGNRCAAARTLPARSDPAGAPEAGDAAPLLESAGHRPRHLPWPGGRGLCPAHRRGLPGGPAGLRHPGGSARRPPPSPPDRGPAPARTTTPRIDFRPGAADASGFPRSAWAASLRRATLTAPPASLGYPDPRGVPEARAALAAYLGRVRGVDVEADGLLITSGFAQGLALLARALPARYSRAVAVEDPGSPGAVGQVQRAGLRPVPVGVDAEGMRVDQLAASAARLALVTPAHQFPTGVVLGPRRRAELLAGTDEEDLVRRAAAAGIGLYGLGGFHLAGRSPTPGLVLGYGSLSEGEISAGVEVLADLLDSRA